MLWEIIFEMLGELFAVVGEILGAFWGLGKAAVKHFQDPKKNPEEQAKQRAQLILISAILGLGIAIAFMFPGVRNFVFRGGKPPAPAMLVEAQRNPLPMGQFTTPQLFKKKKMVVGEKGAQRTIFYYLYAPKAAVGQKLPLVVVLHGKDGMDQAAMYLRAGSVQKIFPSYILIPQMPQGKVWDTPAKYSGEEFPKAAQTPIPPKELTYLPDVISELEEVMSAAAPDGTLLHSIDDSRLYVAGCDEGAAGVYGAAAHYPGIFAGGVAIAGKWSFLDRGKLAKTPLLILHGANDKKPVPPDFATNMAQVINAVRGKAAVHVFPGIDHNCDAPDFYAQVVWQWLFAQALPPAPEAPPPAPAVANTAAPVPAPAPAAPR